MNKKVEKTEKAILAAYFQLLEKKGDGRITISEIARCANIDRKTFYLHYDSVEDINKKFCQKKAERLIERMHEARLSDDDLPVEQFIFILNEEISQRDTVFIRRLVSKKGMNYFLDAAQEELTKATVERYHSLFKISKEELTFCVRLYVSGVLAVYIKWLEEGRPFPIENLAEMITKTINAGIKDALKDPTGK